MRDNTPAYYETSRYAHLTLLFQLQHPRQDVRPDGWSMRLLALLIGLHTRHAGVYCIMSGAVSGDPRQSQSNSSMKSG